MSKPKLISFAEARGQIKGKPVKLFYIHEQQASVCGLPDGQFAIITDVAAADLSLPMALQCAKKYSEVCIPIDLDDGLGWLTDETIPYKPGFDFERILLEKIQVGGITFICGYGPQTQTWVVQEI